LTDRDDLILPGDVLASSEEYLAGEGTYEEGGHVRAACLGQKVVDEVDRVVSIAPRGVPPRRIMVGDVVVGLVTVLKNQLANLRISAIEGVSRPYLPESLGTIHISNVEDHFITDLGRYIRPGDMVRARVLQAEPTIQLTTRGDDMGVVKGRCGYCNGDLALRDEELRCPNCQVTWQKKVSRLYGNTNLLEDR